MIEGAALDELRDRLDGAPIDVRWNAVLGALPAIGKDSHNQQQNFDYRSIDSVLDRLKPLFAACGVHPIPVRQVAEREERETASGKAMYVCHITVDWQIRSVNGDVMEAQTLGEGADMGDKATSKAQTMALKYLLWPALTIATNEDPDGVKTEETVARSGSTAGSTPTSRSRSSSQNKDKDSKVGLIIKIAKDISMSSDDLKAFIDKLLARETSGFDDLSALEQTVIVEALRAKEREGEG